VSAAHALRLATPRDATPRQAPALHLQVARDWPLARLLARRAARRQWPVTLTPATLPPRLVVRVAREATHAPPETDVDLLLPTAGELAWAIAAAGVRRMLAACSPAPGRVECVVLAPAAGWCGASATGPIDAIRIEGARTLTGAAGPTSGQLRLITTPQTRCWVATCTWHGMATRVSIGASGFVALPGQAATDTARLTQHMYDRGHGRDWDELALLDTGTDGGTTFAAAFTDTPYIEALLDGVAAARTAPGES
jgi:hypothetical protein